MPIRSPKLNSFVVVYILVIELLTMSQWYYVKTGMVSEEQVGPISLKELSKEIRMGDLRPEDHVASPSHTKNKWYQVRQFPKLMEVMDPSIERVLIKLQERRLFHFLLMSFVRFRHRLSRLLKDLLVPMFCALLPFWITLNLRLPIAFLSLQFLFKTFLAQVWPRLTCLVKMLVPAKICL